MKNQQPTEGHYQLAFLSMVWLIVTIIAVVVYYYIKDSCVIYFTF